MKLKELLVVVDSKVTLELTGTIEKYETKPAIPDELKNHEVKLVEAKDNGVVIKLGEPPKVPTLEEMVTALKQECNKNQVL